MIRKASPEDASLLSKISIDSFIPAHGHSAPKDIINNYMRMNFSVSNLIHELNDPSSHFFLLYHENQIAGYSKVMFNQVGECINTKKATYMSRLYLLKQFYNLGLGKQLFDYNVAYCKENHQKSIWLKVWVENEKAIAFYRKMGFKQVGLSDFKLSEDHYNPNYVLSLEI